jgi:hypothetical protein
MVHDSEKSNTPFSAIILIGSYDLHTYTLAVERAKISRKVLHIISLLVTHSITLRKYVDLSSQKREKR